MSLVALRTRGTSGSAVLESMSMAAATSSFTCAPSEESRIEARAAPSCSLPAGGCGAPATAHAVNQRLRRKFHSRIKVAHQPKSGRVAKTGRAEFISRIVQPGNRGVAHVAGDPILAGEVRHGGSRPAAPGDQGQQDEGDENCASFHVTSPMGGICE